MIFMSGSSNPFTLNPFGKPGKPIPISKTPIELTRIKYHAECNECGANIDSIRIKCSECNQSYCKGCADVDTGICHKCTKKIAGRLTSKDKSTSKSRSSIDQDVGTDGDGSDPEIDFGGSKSVPKFGKSWGSTKKG